MLKLAAIIVGLLIAATLAWGGSEFHYRNCIEAAESTHPVSRDWAEITRGENARGGGPKPPRGTAARRKAVDGCSHLPF